jgi:hypothetical protein
MEFPRVVYFGVQTPGAWRCQKVHDAEAYQRALSEGWTPLPVFEADPAPVSEPEPVPEPAPPKRKPGRPRKAQS